MCDACARLYAFDLAYAMTKNTMIEIFLTHLQLNLELVSYFCLSRVGDRTVIYW